MIRASSSSLREKPSWKKARPDFRNASKVEFVETSKKAAAKDTQQLSLQVHFIVSDAWARNWKGELSGTTDGIQFDILVGVLHDPVVEPKRPILANQARDDGHKFDMALEVRIILFWNEDDLFPAPCIALT
ncbi:hypothetical protein ACHAXT_002350 [Thalassiosira profunda]